MGTEDPPVTVNDLPRALLEPAVAEFAELGSDPAVIALKGQLARAYFLDEEPRRAIEKFLERK